MLKKLSEKSGLTLTEIKVISFLIFIFAVGAGVKYLLNKPEKVNINYDYSKEDSLFNKLSHEAVNNNNSKDLLSPTVDSNREVLDFKQSDFIENSTGRNSGIKKSVILKAGSIDLNHASINELILLPGIGRKIASDIIEYRKKFGDFKELDELKNVKGIGDSRFNKIKDYLIIK